MTPGKNKSIPVNPGGIFGIVFQKPAPEHMGCGGKAHGSTGMSGVCLLDGIHGKGSDGINTLLIKVLGGSRHFSLLCDETAKGFPPAVLLWFSKGPGDPL
jgi:hypothetical protein